MSNMLLSVTQNDEGSLFTTPWFLLFKFMKENSEADKGIIGLWGGGGGGSLNGILPRTAKN